MKKKLPVIILLSLFILISLGGFIYSSRIQSAVVYDASLTYQEQFSNYTQLQNYLQSKGLKEPDTITPLIVYGIGGLVVLSMVGWTVWDYGEKWNGKKK